MKRNQVTVAVRFNTERTRSCPGSVLMFSPYNVIVPRTSPGDCSRLIESIEVRSLLNAHQSGRCASVAIKGIVALPNENRAMSTHHFLELARFNEVVEPDGNCHGCYWRLAKGKGFLEEAVCIVEIVLARLGARYWDDHPHRTSYGELMKGLSISQTTFVSDPASVEWRSLADVMYHKKYK